jgi:hypothetical protein
MIKSLSCCLSVGLVFLASAAQPQSTPADEVTKDAKGRVLSRKTTNPDQSGHRTSYEYGARSDRPSVILDEDLDRFDRVTKRVEQRFDDEGRIWEKLEIRIDAAGTRTGTRTRYSYDQSGRRSEHVTPVS